MIDEELLEKTLAETFIISEEMSEEERQQQMDLRAAFKSGVQWGYDHPYFNKGCPDREWHYLTEDPTDLPEVNKVCLIKFSDGTGGVSSMIYKTKTVISESRPMDDHSELSDTPTNTEPQSTSITYKVWVTKYRDDIIAWSYYFVNKVNGNYI